MQSNRIGDRRKWIVPVLLVACAAIVAFWEIMAARSRNPFRPFGLTAEDFREFKPSSSAWSLYPRPLPPDSSEPNILAYEVRRMLPTKQGQNDPLLPARAPAAPVLVRLVHGYNMCDCMRIKGYKVEPIEQKGFGQESGGRSQRSEQTTDRPFRQVWRLTSSSGEVSVWVTGMIRAGDFSETDVDVRSMAFPRIGIPDDPRWIPRGLTWKSLRHPIGSFRVFLRAKWNSSRCDVATFLGLKQPAWADDELLTLVAAWRGASVAREQEPSATEHVLAAYDFFCGELEKWRRESEPEKAP
jgi:hypothetical protein